MVIGLIGESCTGKSILAEKLARPLDAQFYTGKDYLKPAPNGAIAKKLFQKNLCEAVNGAHTICVITEDEHLRLLPDGAIRVLVTASLDTIKERFARRMNGTLPAPVAAMLERKHGCFDAEPHDIHFVSGQSDPDGVCARILSMISVP